MERGRKRFVRGIAAVLSACAVLFAAYWFTRPPELVWWRSPEMQSTGSHIRVLVPYGWVPTSESRSAYHYWMLRPADTRPFFIRKLFPRKTESGRIVIQAGLLYSIEGNESTRTTTIDKPSSDSEVRIVHGVVKRRDLAAFASVEYIRHDIAALYRTYRQICDSLTIE